VIQARFVYNACIYGRWTPVNPSGPMMVPNPDYADALLGVEFKETANEAALPRRPKGYAYKAGVVPNGRAGEPEAPGEDRLEEGPDRSRAEVPAAGGPGHARHREGRRHGPVRAAEIQVGAREETG
jgi:hypothetical protein